MRIKQNEASAASCTETEVEASSVRRTCAVGVVAFIYVDRESLNRCSALPLG